MAAIVEEASRADIVSGARHGSTAETGIDIALLLKDSGGIVVGVVVPQAHPDQLIASAVLIAGTAVAIVTLVVTDTIVAVITRSLGAVGDTVMKTEDRKSQVAECVAHPPRLAVRKEGLMKETSRATFLMSYRPKPKKSPKTVND